MTGKLDGLGLGPGDPELITLKAHRILTAAPVVAYPAPDTGPSFARQIAAAYLSFHQVEVPIVVPMRVERFPAREIYDEAADTLSRHLDAGLDACRRTALPWFAPLIEALPPPNRIGKDPKTALQEWLQARARSLPAYELVGESGEEHARIFTVACTVGDAETLLTRHFTTPETPRYGGKPALPTRLAYLLDHSYTPRALAQGVGRLKGVDAQRAAMEAQITTSTLAGASPSRRMRCGSCARK